MNAAVEKIPAGLRVAHLHTRLEWGDGEAQLLALVRQMNARGIFTVLVAPARGALYPRARQAGVRVIALKDGRRAGKQLGMDLQEFDLTHLHVHDTGALAPGLCLKRELRIPLVLDVLNGPPPKRHPLLRWSWIRCQADAFVSTPLVVEDTLAAYARMASPQK